MTVFSVSVVALLAIIEATSVVFFVGWGIPMIRAYRAGSVRTKRRTLVDFIGFNVAAFLVATLAVYNVIQYGVPEPSSWTFGAQRIAQTLLIAGLCTLRCVIWFLERREQHSGVPELPQMQDEAS